MNSIRYRNRPLSFAKQIIKTISTRSSVAVSYKVKLNSNETQKTGELDSGLIYTHKGLPGHAVYLVDLRKNGLFDRLEGPFPAQHSTLLTSIFAENKFINKANLRRM